MAYIWKIKLRRLEKYRCGFFDTNTGYFQIPQSVGVDSPSEILFLTDGYQEAVVEKAAGLEVMISVRPGNGPLPENHGFKTIESLLKSEIQDDLSNSVEQ